VRIFNVCAAILLLCAAGFGQTQALGMGAFANEKGPIQVAVDASLVDFQISQPYAMFVIYMAAKSENRNIVVGRDTLVMVYQGQEYKMTPFKELRENYRAEIRDLDFYRHLGKEGIVSTWVRFYSFPQKADFFPPQTLSSSLAVDEASLYGFTGFRTKAYFKNPGFKKGDKITFRVWDKKDPNIDGEVEVVLK
jgi:hypothetical protein